MQQATKWEKRHDTVERALPEQSVRSVTFSPCSLGFCVCKGWWPRLLRKFKLFFRSVPKDDINAGLIIFTWRPFAVPEVPGNDPDASRISAEVGAGAPMVERHVHLSVCKWSPFRLTFAEMETCLCGASKPCFKPCRSKEDKLRLTTLYEWIAQLDWNMALDVAVAKLSTSGAAMPAVTGHVRAEYIPEIQQRIWKGLYHECLVRRRRRRVPVHEALDRAERCERARGPKKPYFT